MKKNFFLSFFLSSIFAGYFFSPSFAETNYLDEASSNLIYEKAPTEDSPTQRKEEKRFRFDTGFQQINGFIVSSDHISQLFFAGTYQFEKSWSVSLTQKLNRHYFLNPNSEDQGLWIQDTILSIDTQFTGLPYDSRLKTGLSSTLPLSYDSQVTDLLTVSTVYFNWSLKLDSLLNFQSKWIKNPVFFIKPVTRYYFSRYTTSRTMGQSLGGTPLPEFLLGIQSLGLSLNITDHFSLTGTYGRWLVFPYKTKYKKMNTALTMSITKGIIICSSFRET